MRRTLFTFALVGFGNFAMGAEAVVFNVTTLDGSTTTFYSVNTDGSNLTTLGSFNYGGGFSN